MGDELERFLANARGSAATPRGGGVIMSLDELRARRGNEPAFASWDLATLRGRLVELSARGATATLTTAMELVVEAQTQHEPVAWLTLVNGTFYPPDVAECGVDLAALVVVRTLDAVAAARAGERLLRSGAFGLIVIDLGAGNGNELTMQIQGRLVTLAQTHDAAVVCLTQKADDTASVGSLVSLRAEALRTRDARNAAGELTVTVRVLKDKRRGPGWTQTLKRRGPAGLI
ncbi:MAG TPA: recombinase A [Kofleriaceae bacterium]